MITCPRCNKTYNASRLRALSRYGNYYVCDRCGNKEALQILLENGGISEEYYREQCKKIDSIYGDD